LQVIGEVCEYLTKKKIRNRFLNHKTFNNETNTAFVRNDY
jgi:hypothetical protein